MLSKLTISVVMFKYLQEIFVTSLFTWWLQTYMKLVVKYIVFIYSYSWINILLCLIIEHSRYMTYYSLIYADRYLNGTNFRVDRCSRFSRILLKFEKLNHREIFDNRRFAKINPRENFGNGKLAKIIFAMIFLKKFFLLCIFPPFIFQATNTIQMCIMKL